MTCDFESWLPLQADKRPPAFILYYICSIYFQITSRNLCSVLSTIIATQESNLVPHKWLCSITWHLFLNSTKTPAHRMFCLFFFLQYFCCSPAVWNMLWLRVLQTTSCDEDYLNYLFIVHSETEYAETITNR